MFFLPRNKGVAYNILLWVFLFVGLGLQACFYFMEAYARKSCPANVRFGERVFGYWLIDWCLGYILGQSHSEIDCVSYCPTINESFAYRFMNNTLTFLSVIFDWSSPLIYSCDFPVSSCFLVSIKSLHRKTNRSSFRETFLHTFSSIQLFASTPSLNRSRGVIILNSVAC